mmetsp:Transcript_29631/g.45405  ORF Transcript_29631/g.45405 Transcript_29631/m.45405 type:complete len:409 (+) Transcript_29631:169-1395(+)|eukprot:CAMPEP_0118680216 /NCGR_PEP_ID=MMETSP0800-20121206/4230_1 /TAXON_ID=210618 ORGANISM="Striatella unipunctata, Strain CCMP2910" /NCGR_SAMPLE_ID=MMETSP0800 /ASSEMBLY_ACC=CAM_ASM_000638 /LENGTH=408 /DNA_ID=CAMNT_0006576317 /DNA_START=368 /DNA_END=1594 /DNA_ORIENTATION=+
MKSVSSSSSWFTSPTVKWILISLTGIILAIIATIPQIPHPKFDIDEFVMPLARDYASKLPNNNNNNKERPLEGTVALITGPTSGIGLALTRKLTALGVNVIAVGRSPNKLQKLRDEMPTSIQTVQAEFSDLDEVAKAADEIRSIVNDGHIDFWINNAGTHDGVNNLFGTTVTKQGYDPVFAINYLSHVLLTEKCIDLLERAPQPVLLQISSSFHWAVDGQDLVVPPNSDSLSPLASRPGGATAMYLYRSTRSYANSKLAQIYHARSLTTRNKKIRAISICPSWVYTNITRFDSNSLEQRTFKSLAYPLEGWGIVSAFMGMLDTTTTASRNDFYTNTQLFANPQLMEFSSWCPAGLREVVVHTQSVLILIVQKFYPAMGPSTSSPESYNVKLQQGLWEWTRQKALAKYL